MSSVTTTPDQYSLKKGWRTLALAGGVIGLVGLVAIAFPFVTGMSISVLLGALLIVSGIVHGVHAFSAGSWRGSAWQVVLGIVSVLAGIVLLVNPVFGLVALTLLLVAYLLVDGVTELWMSVRMKGQEGRGWIAASGVISLILAGILWAGFPADATWALGLLVGISLLMTGLSMVFVAFAGRDAEDVTPSATEPRSA